MIHGNRNENKGKPGGALSVWRQAAVEKPPHGSEEGGLR
jgi:hypothetical protein